MNASLLRAKEDMPMSREIGNIQTIGSDIKRQQKPYM